MSRHDITHHWAHLSASAPDSYMLTVFRTLESRSMTSAMAMNHVHAALLTLYVMTACVVFR